MKEEILKAGLKIWREQGVHKINARNIGKIIGKTHPMVYHHYENQEKLIIAITDYGLEIGDSTVIVSLMFKKDPRVTSLSEKECMKHLNIVRSSV